MHHLTSTTIAQQHRAELIAEADRRRQRRAARSARRNETR
jgi:hypothetical protein